jgi:hypothetical protein
MNNLFKPILAILAFFFISTANAQTASIALTTQPCNNNGVLTATFTGLTTPLTVTWYVGIWSTPIVHTNVTTLSDVLNGYSGAQAYVVATDASNKSAYDFFQGAPPFNYSVATTPAVCPAPGSLQATITGGTAPYTYSWFDVSNNTVVGTTNPVSVPAGEYNVTITDANGCVYGSLAKGDSITVANSSTINFTLSGTQASCTNGTASSNTPTGGIAPYSFLWSNSATSQSISGLTQGSYSLKVTDAQGCHQTKSIYLQQSPNINVNTTPTPATCVQNNGAIQAFGSGGTPPYTYLWNNSATTQSINGLGVGYYTVKVTDANGCFGNGGGYVSASTPINATVSTTPSACTTSNGSATLSISGGATPYSIQWATMPVQTTATANGLGAGLHSFKITDANGCIRTGTAEVKPVNIINVNLIKTSPVCALTNGHITANSSGGNPPYSYLWSTSATTPAITGLAPGSYSVKVTDNIGCSVTKQATLTAFSPVNVALSTTPASCIFTSDGVATATVWGGATPYTYSWSNSGTTASISGLKTGYYSVAVTDANGCKANKTTVVGYNPAGNSCYCTITGTVYNDVNNNCTKDAGEAGIPNIAIHCSGIGYAYTNASGVYSFKVPTGSYTITETVLGYYPLAACQTNGISVNVTAAANCSTTVNFANNTATIHDMHISTWNYNCPVPGYTYNQKVIVSNMGTVNENSIKAGYLTDGNLLTPTFSPGGIFTGTGLWREIVGGALTLGPGASQSFFASYSVPVNVPLNTSLVFKDTVAYQGPISNWTNDYSPWNNVNYYTPVVVGSYDPNFKEVMPKGIGPNGDISKNDTALEYMIHFQNLGTYMAQNIFILDTLDADLDWESMRPIYKSHPCDVTMSEGGVIKFNFPNINLPAKQDDEPGSNGMVTFSIKTKKNLSLGTQFHNSAAIYFDFNEPVITNTTVNTIAPVSVEEVRGNSSNSKSVTVYPNPTGGMLTIKMHKDQYTSLRLMNVMGQVCAQHQLTERTEQVDVSSLTPGIYYMLFTGPNGKTVEKLEKQ